MYTVLDGPENGPATNGPPGTLLKSVPAGPDQLYAVAPAEVLVATDTTFPTQPLTGIAIIVQLPTGGVLDTVTVADPLGVPEQSPLLNEVIV